MVRSAPETSTITTGTIATIPATVTTPAIKLASMFREEIVSINAVQPERDGDPNPHPPAPDLHACS